MADTHLDHQNEITCIEWDQITMIRLVVYISHEEPEIMAKKFLF